MHNYFDCQKILSQSVDAIEAGSELLEEALNNKVIHGEYSIEDYEHIALGMKIIKSAVKSVHMLKPVMGVGGVANVGVMAAPIVGGVAGTAKP